MITTDYDDDIRVHRQFFSPSDLDAMALAAAAVKFRPVPKWLGDFRFAMFTGHARLPSDLGPFARRLAALAPGQRFNVAFVQRYAPGQGVKEHRDPHSNLGHTVIAVFGAFTGAGSLVAGARLQLAAGDVAVQRCTVDGVRGPAHSVSPVLTGLRYALILNTIK